MSLYLYIKQHSVTGKLYFGKTKENPETYPGSGKHWKNHIKKHGKEHVVTLWYCLFLDQESCTEFALLFSKQHNIVESSDWLNQIVENGLDGFPLGQKRGKMSDDHKIKIQTKLTGRPYKPQSKETIEKKTGINHPLYGKRGSETPRFGMKNTPESIAKMSAAQKGLVTVFDLIEQKVVKIPKIEFESNKGSKYVGVASKLARNYLRQQ